VNDLVERLIDLAIDVEDPLQRFPGAHDSSR
jgi:hypothetical protein